MSGERVERLCARCFTGPYTGRKHAAFRQGFIRDSVISPAGTAHQPDRGHKTFCGRDATGWRCPTYGQTEARS